MRHIHLETDEPEFDIEQKVQLEYWPGKTAISLGRLRISYCELMQYVFGVGLISVIIFIVVGVGRDLNKG